MAQNFDLFIKLMMLSTSDQDGEALSALRKAQVMLAQQNTSWEELLRSKVKFTNVYESSEKPGARSEKPRERSKASSESTSNERHYEYEEIDAMFDHLLAEVDSSSSFYEFLESVYEWWEKNGYLTDKQYQAIKRSYHRSAA